MEWYDEKSSSRVRSRLFGNLTGSVIGSEASKSAVISSTGAALGLG